MTVETLSDRIEILELTARYNRAADGTDPGPLLAVFTEDATVEMRGGADGPAVFAGPELAKLVAPADGQRVHMTMDSIVDVDGDRATQEVSLLLLTRAPRRGVAAVFTGRYSDELVRTSAGWRFARRLVHVDYENEARMALATTKEAG
jgi:hypothetical protein